MTDPEACPGCGEDRLVSRHATYRECKVCSRCWVPPKPDVRDIAGVVMNTGD